MQERDGQLRLHKMTLDDAWLLYKILQHALSGTNLESVDDEIGYISEHAQDGTMLRSIRIIYDGLPDKINPFEIVLLFMRGIQLSGFMTFIAFIRGFDNGNR